MIYHSIKESIMAENLKADIVGGHDISSLRAVFDHDDKNIILASSQHLIYYDVKTCDQVGKANLNPSKLTPGEKIVSCERLDISLYIATNSGKIYVWNLEARDWTNELSLPIIDGESLVSCKMLSKRQYIYSVLDSSTNITSLYFSMSRSERERPKQREVIGRCNLGEQNTFDLGRIFGQDDLELETKSKQEKLAKQRYLTYIRDNAVYFHKVAISEKMSTSISRQKIKDFDFTCVKANPKKPMVAAGDAMGRIYLYSGDFETFKFNRTKLHWHTLPVNDLCFSNTGNTLFSVGGESGCVVVWDLSSNNLSQKRIFARLGMPLRHINCSNILNQLILTFEDNEIQFMDTDGDTRKLRTFTRRTIDMYLKNDYRALRVNSENTEECHSKSIGLLWHSKTDTVMTNGKTGWLQFYSPKTQSSKQALNFLKANILSLESAARVIPSEITKAALTLDGEWLAFYETRDSDQTFADVKLHIWQRSNATNRWAWIQTADRLHSSTAIVDLKFSPDGQFLLSVCEDGSFQVLHRVCLDAKVNSNSKSKQMYAKGFVGNVPKDLPSMATFSEDSSVMAMSLKNNTTLIWMIVDPYKLVYECQLNQIDKESEQVGDDDAVNLQPKHRVIGLHFGYHQPSQSLAPLCEVRSKSIRIWNILDLQETMEYPVSEEASKIHQDDEFTAAAFDQCPGDSRSLDHFAVSTKSNKVLIFRLQISQATRTLTPLIIIDATVHSASTKTSYYTDMCFLSEPILEIDPQCHQDSQLVKLLNRLCLMNNHQELISITDKLTLERQSASNSCNAIRTYDINELQQYFVKNATSYSEEARDLRNSDETNSIKMTEKQRRIRRRLEVQKMLKDLFTRIPSQNLPQMEILGPMILDKPLKEMESQEQKNKEVCNERLTELDAFLYGLPGGLLLAAFLLLCFTMFGKAISRPSSNKHQPSASSNTRITRKNLLGKKKNRGPPPSAELKPVDMKQLALSENAPDDIRAMALAGKIAIS